jgi:formylglycine-generating enzyme required for sulfatase activity
MSKGIVKSLLIPLLITSSGLSMAEELKADYVDDMGIEFMLIKPGKFLMGRDANIPLGYDPELPQHEVTVEHQFYLAKYETTQAQWTLVMDKNPSDFVDPERPVENVSFIDAQAFIKILNERYPDFTYRLPSEAQWEYAARAGSTKAYFFGANQGELNLYGWHIGNTSGGSQKGGKLAANPWGLHDMNGNVAEWVEDCWHPNYLEAPKTDIAWTTSTGWFSNNCKERVLRGGSWFSPAFELRSAYRFRHFKFNRSQHKGFRLAVDKN